MGESSGARINMLLSLQPRYRWWRGLSAEEDALGCPGLSWPVLACVLVGLARSKQRVRLRATRPHSGV
jgi:hypothetical protein